MNDVPAMPDRKTLAIPTARPLLDPRLGDIESDHSATKQRSLLAIAGSLAKKKYVPPSLGTLPVTTPLFSVLLVGVIVIVGALTFFPALSLGPILEHLLMQAGKTF